ncbi:MAG TPA: Vi polysaccharide biosynthesis UDP-N-acetylglucosamine C-6 dehydrogenase TviB, partial [Gammaproteobacteria bacterium]|nr:Vi polysaccharide biosynthesis UDP-N-acetylglucosamine C-6 dehydrogenase TviB [Gammaproteobacteria bacterium]
GLIGLGYVGLPLAVELGKKYPTKGLDISAERVAELQSGQDSTLEVEPEGLEQAFHLSCHSDLENILPAGRVDGRL